MSPGLTAQALSIEPSSSIISRDEVPPADANVPDLNITMCYDDYDDGRCHVESFKHKECV